MSIKVTSIEGNRQLLDGGSMFGNAPRPLWERWVKVDDLGRIELACRSLLIEYNDKKILLEAGIGAFFPPELASRYGVTPVDQHVLLSELKKKNIQPEDIDYVILSHLHFDHAGGLVPAYEEFSKSPRLIFSNAVHITGQTAWERAMNPHPRDRASFIPEIINLLKDNILVLSQDNPRQDLPQEIQSIFDFTISDGHTPGQLLTVVKGESQDLIFCGDLIPGTPWVNLPITMGYDRFPELLIDEKKKLYESSNLESRLFFYTHDDTYACSKIEINQKKKYAPVDPIKELNQFEL